MEEKNHLQIIQNQSSSSVTSAITLHVQIIAARDLAVADLTASDPYVEVWLGDGKDDNDPKKSKYRTYKTRVEKYNLNPVWDEEMVWELERSSIDMGEEVQLCMHVWDEDAIGSHDSLGYAKLPLSHLFRDNVKVDDGYECWLPLRPRTEKSLARGDIRIHLQYGPHYDECSSKAR